MYAAESGSRIKSGNCCSRSECPEQFWFIEEVPMTAGFRIVNGKRELCIFSASDDRFGIYNCEHGDQFWVLTFVGNLDNFRILNLTTKLSKIMYFVIYIFPS